MVEPLFDARQLRGQLAALEAAQFIYMRPCAVNLQSLAGECLCCTMWRIYPDRFFRFFRDTLDDLQDRFAM